jgi:hypothetical protein
MAEETVSQGSDAGRLEEDRVVARSAQRDLAVLEGAALQQQGGAS